MREILVGLLTLLVIACAAGSAFAAADAASAPMLWRNSGAFTAPAGLPRARGAEIPEPGRTRFALGVEVASQFTQDTEGAEDAIIDVETTTTLLSLEHGFADIWSASIEIPFVSHDGGFLDELIDDYHDALGLPDGGRKSRPRDEILVRWQDARGVRRALTDGAAEFGDIRIGFARALVREADRTTAIRLGLELPTGNVDALTGNDGIDVSLAWHLTDRRLLEGWGWTLHTALGVLAQVDRDQLYDGDGENFVGFGNLTLAWPLGDRWVLKGQLDAHSATADTRLRQVGGWSVGATLGLAVRVTDTLVFEGGFAEDLPPGSAPDIAFLFALRGAL